MAISATLSGCGQLGHHPGDRPILGGSPSAEGGQATKYGLTVADLPDGWTAVTAPHRVAPLAARLGEQRACSGLVAFISHGAASISSDFHSDLERASSEIFVEPSGQTANQDEAMLHSPKASACLAAVATRVLAQSSEGGAAAPGKATVVPFPKVLNFTIDFRTTATAVYKGLSLPTIVDLVVIGKGRLFALLTFTKAVRPGDLPGADDGLEGQAADAVARRIVK